MPSASSYSFMSAHPPLSCSDAGEEMDAREVDNLLRVMQVVDGDQA